MAVRALLLVVVLIAAACGGGSPSTLAPTIPGLGGSQNPGTSSAPLVTLPPATGGGTSQDFRASGAKLRIANFYRDATGKPTDLDIYGDFNAQAGPLLKTVAYGTISDFFDPGILDDQGDMEVSYYPKGKTGSDDQVGSQTETLKGKEVITMAIGTGENKSQNGTAFARWKVFFENGADYPLPTAPTSGAAVLMADGVAIAAFPKSTETFVYVGVGGTCLPSVEGGPAGGGQPFGPQSQQNYLFPAGSQAVSIALGQPDCKAKSPYPDIPVDLKAGQRAWLFFYTPDDQTLKTLLVPVSL